MGTTPGHTDYATYLANGGYSLAAAIVNGEDDENRTILAMENSGLRGLGGAGFPAGAQVAHCAQPACTACDGVNIEGGEPGTFKDRTYLE